jgi:predicted nuclease of predicted toxin-antitoxin system
VSERVRFHLDEHMHPAIAQALRRHGVDVTTTIEAELRTGDDHAQLAFARSEGRILVTDDADFLRFAGLNRDHSGIAFCRRSRLSVGQIINGLLLIYEVMTPTEMAGRVEFV